MLSNTKIIQEIESIRDQIEDWDMTALEALLEVVNDQIDVENQAMEDSV